MNIGIIMHSYLPKIGGAQISAHCLANRLSKMGYNVTVYADRNLVNECNERGWLFQYKLKGVLLPPTFLKKFTKLWPCLLYNKIKNILIEDKIQVIQIIFAWPWLPAAKIIKKKLNIPVVLRSAGDDIQIDHNVGYGILREKGIRKLLLGSFADVDAAVAISPTVTEEYKKVGIPEKKIEEIPPGVDVQVFENYKTNKTETCDHYNIPQDKRIIIAVGRNHPKKGFRDLVESLTYLNNNETQFVVVIVGDGTDELLAEANQFDVSDSVIPIPAIARNENDIETFPSKELIALYKIADYFVHPSYIETYANVALEAMAARVPVIVTDAPGCIDTITDFEDGLIVPTKSPQKIAEKILLLEKEPELRSKLVERGFQKALKQDWIQISKRYVNIYNRCVSVK